MFDSLLHPIHAERIAPRAVRFSVTSKAARAALPSFALEREPTEKEHIRASSCRTRPTFSQVEGRQRVTIAHEQGTSYYGTGEVAGPLLRNGRRIVCWNSDHPFYSVDEESLYQSHPWVLAVRADGSAFGVLADTTYRCTVDLTDGILFEADGPPYPVIIIEGDSPQGVLRTLADLTGHMQMPPKWALGFQQCRWSYYPESRVREIADEFRKRRIPCDVIWMDIHYMHGYRIFTFDPEHFPEPKALNDYLHERGFKATWMIDPGVKHDPGYTIYEEGTAGDHWVKTPDGEPYVGDVWPGPCVFPDFTREETAAWWGELYKPFLDTGIDGVWNDMNEPSVFTSPTKLMPEECVHRGMGGDTHDRFHNVYGMLMVRASLAGILKAQPDKRPFLLTRSNYIGGHRYAATWTGDNASTWPHLRMSTPMVLNFGLSGQPFVGPDIGGFGENADATMFGRWVGIGALYPFSRAHTAEGTEDHEPWVFGPETEKTCRVAIERRYRLIPYIYTCFHEAASIGLPIMRPLFFADPADPALRDEDEAFLLGADLLVVTQPHPEPTRTPARPNGNWRKLLLDDVVDPELPELFLRGGAILPVGPLMQFVDEKPLDPLTLVICLDENGEAAGDLYEDAGDGFGFRNGEYRLSRYTAKQEADGVTIQRETVEGEFAVPPRRLHVRVLMDSGELTVDADDNGHPVRVPFA